MLRAAGYGVTAAVAVSTEQGSGMLPHVLAVGVAVGTFIVAVGRGGAVGVAADGGVVTVAVFVGTTAVGAPGNDGVVP